MKKILYIATSDISLRTGGGLANLALLRSLCKDYSDLIDVVHYQKSLDKEKYPYNFFFVPPISKVEKLIGICQGHIHRFTPWLKKFLAEKGERYSHCIINAGILGEYVDLFHEFGIKVMVIHHNYECEFQMDNKRPSTFFGLTDFFVRKSERKSYENADYNVFLSYDDIGLFHKHYPKKQYLNESAIGIFKPEYNLKKTSSDLPLNYRMLCICGSLNSVQTRKGLQDFCTKYFDIIKATLNNNFTLKIAGRNPSKQLVRWTDRHENVVILPNPLDMDEAVKDCGIFICPTNVGGGIKLRILDGLSLGMPVLTHEVSARGYNVLHHYPWFQIYHDQASFEHGLKIIINEIKTNPSLRQEIHTAYHYYFSLESGDKKFREVVRNFLSDTSLPTVY